MRRSFSAMSLVILAASTLAGQSTSSMRPLFDGKTTTGWRGFKKPGFPEKGWVVEDGWLKHLAARGEPSSGDIMTVDTFDNFDLQFEWKVALGANSGVKYLVTEDRKGPIAHEYQVIDDERHADAKIGPHRQTAALYDVFPAHDRPMKPAGEWNTSEVIVKGNHVEHLLNGKKVLEYELDSPALREAIAKSKFKDIARFGKPQSGHILVQDHGNQVWFRKLEIKKTK